MLGCLLRGMQSIAIIAMPDRGYVRYPSPRHNAEACSRIHLSIVGACFLHRLEELLVRLATGVQQTG